MQGGLLLLGDQAFAFTPTTIVIPFASPYAPVAVGVGQLAFYVVAIVTGSFYVRRQIGQRAWRLIHYLTFLAFVGGHRARHHLGIRHRRARACWVYLAPTAAVVFFFVYRLVAGLATKQSAERPPVPTSGETLHHL